MHHQFDLPTPSDAEAVAVLSSEFAETTVDGASETVSAEEFSRDQQLGQRLSYLLKCGVLSAGALIFVGGVLYLIDRGAEEAANYQFFQKELTVCRSPVEVVTAVLSGSSQGIIQLGLLLLIATPIARVAVSLLTFLSQRDFTYVFVTGLVLIGLIYSFVGAYFKLF